jgi:hypothetical protein
VRQQQPNVRFERTGQPQIIYQQAEGQPQVRFEPMGSQDVAAADRSAARGSAPAVTPPAAPSQAASSDLPAPAMTQQRAQAQLNRAPGYGTAQPRAPEETGLLAAVPGPASEPHQTGALPGAAPEPVAVERLRDMALFNAREEKLGDIDEIYAGPDNRLFAVVTYGGFLGLGEKRVVVPLEQVAMRGDRLVAESLSDDQIRALPSFGEGDATYKELEDGQTANVRVLR